MELKGSLPHSQVPATCPYPETARSSPHPTSWRSKLILSSHLRLGLPSGLFPLGSPTKTLHTPLLSPYALHEQPISFFSIGSPEQYWVRSTYHWVPHYVVFSNPLFPRPSYAQIFPSAPYSQTPSAYVPPSMWRPSVTPIPRKGKIIA